MKKIVINQKNSNVIELLDDDLNDITLYTKDISKLMELSKICIIETTTGSVIIKPSEINSISVFEIENNKKQKSSVNQKVENSVVSKHVVINQNDVIKD